MSDERYKEEITTNTDCGLAFINDLKPITYKWKAKADVPNNFPDYDEDATTRRTDRSKQQHASTDKNKQQHILNSSSIRNSKNNPQPTPQTHPDVPTLWRLLGFFWRCRFGI